MSLWQAGDKGKQSLLAGLVDQLSQPAGDLAALLRSARILASELNNDELAEWVLSELNGYEKGGELPAYRRVHSPLQGTFTSPFSKVTGIGIPVSQLPEQFRESAKTVPLGHPIKTIEEMTKVQKEQVTIWPQEAVFVVRRHVHMEGHELVELQQTVTRAMVAGVLDAVRNRLLEFVLALVKLDPSLKKTDEALSQLAPGDVDRAFHVTIVGNDNVVATGHHINQQAQSGVAANDLASLLAFFHSKGVAEDDTRDLVAAVQADGERPKRSLGPRVAQWLGRLVGKAAEGTWKVAVESAPTIINKALGAYYGWEREG